MAGDGCVPNVESFCSCAALMALFATACDTVTSPTRHTPLLPSARPPPSTPPSLLRSTTSEPPLFQYPRNRSSAAPNRTIQRRLGVNRPILNGIS